jgi:3-hydroxyacyl-[acyl-carrier-protein] dehydratase
MLLDAVQIQKILPHRFPFLFLDRVISAVPGESIVAQKLVSMSDPILQGHFPGNPILPGVVQVEAMAQAAVVLASLSGIFDPTCTTATSSASRRPSSAPPWCPARCSPSR